MDDFNLVNLNEARNEWSARLINILTPSITIGFDTIFNEAFELCVENEEDDKYLMTYQNFLTRIPKWNTELINVEVKRIIEESNCDYLEDLITCVHIVQLKALTCVRVGQKHKKIDIDIPKLDSFIHKIYILVARKLYTNIYLYEIELTPLEKQKNNRELELIIKEGILNAIRDSIPIEKILRNYLDETTEDELVETKETITKPEVNDTNPMPPKTDLIAEEIQTEVPDSLKLVEEVKTNTIKVKSDNDNKIKLDIQELTPITANAIKDDIEKPVVKFNDFDNALDESNKEEQILAPKSIDRLEKIAEQRAEQRKLEELEEEDNGDKIKILGDITSNVKTEPLPFLDDIITL